MNNINFLTAHMLNFAGPITRVICTLLFVVLGAQFFIVFVLDRPFTYSGLAGSVSVAVLFVWTALFLKKRYGNGQIR